MEEKMPAAGKRKYMEVLKEKFAAFKGNMKNTFVCFPVTQGSIWLFTLLFVLLININDSSVMDFLGRIMFFLVFYGTGSFFTEALYQKCRKLWLRIVLYIALVIPAVLFAWLVTLDYDSMFLAWEYDTIEFYLPRYIACYELVLFTLAVYFCFRKAGFSLEEYLARFFAWAVRVSILYFVLIIGVGLIMGILVELFDVDYDIFIQAQVLLFGIFYVSSLLRGVLPKTGDDGPFAEVLIKYVMTGLVISAFAIIYVYILKILIFRDMPSNSIFRILTGLFIAGLPIWTMNAFYTQHNPLLKISRLLPYLFAPLVLLHRYTYLRKWNHAHAVCLYHAACVRNSVHNTLLFQKTVGWHSVPCFRRSCFCSLLCAGNQYVQYFLQEPEERAAEGFECGNAVRAVAAGTGQSVRRLLVSL